jgi:hypothetical protein
MRKSHFEIHSDDKDITLELYIEPYSETDRVELFKRLNDFALELTGSD